MNKSKRVQEKFKLQDETITDNKVTICENFNTFFVNIGPNLAKGMSNQPQIPESFMGNRISNTIFLEPVTNQEIYELFMSLKNGVLGTMELNQIP